MHKRFLILLANILTDFLKATRGDKNNSWIPPEPFFTVILTIFLVLLILISVFLPCLAPILFLPIILIALILYFKRKFFK